MVQQRFSHPRQATRLVAARLLEPPLPLLFPHVAPFARRHRRRQWVGLLLPPLVPLLVASPLLFLLPLSIVSLISATHFFTFSGVPTMRMDCVSLSAWTLQLDTLRMRVMLAPLRPKTRPIFPGASIAWTISPSSARRIRLYCAVVAAVADVDSVVLPVVFRRPPLALSSSRGLNNTTLAPTKQPRNLLPKTVVRHRFLLVPNFKRTVHDSLQLFISVEFLTDDQS